MTLWCVNNVPRPLPGGRRQAHFPIAPAIHACTHRSVFPTYWRAHDPKYLIQSQFLKVARQLNVHNKVRSRNRNSSPIASDRDEKAVDRIIEKKNRLEIRAPPRCAWRETATSARRKTRIGLCPCPLFPIASAGTTNGSAVGAYGVRARWTGFALCRAAVKLPICLRVPQSESVGDSPVHAMLRR